MWVELQTASEQLHYLTLGNRLGLYQPYELLLVVWYARYLL